jgi:hypothetical protein
MPIISECIRQIEQPKLFAMLAAGESDFSRRLSFGAVSAARPVQKKFAAKICRNKK